MTTYTDNNCNVVKNITLAGLMFLSLILAIFTNFYILSNGDVASISTRFPSGMMASEWIFGVMWSLTYVFEFLWVLYLTILTIKFASRESLFNMSFYFAFIVVNVGNCILVYLWNDAVNTYYDNYSKYLMYAFIVCIIMDLCLYWALFQSMLTLLSPVHTGLLPEWVTSTIRKLLIVILINAIGFYVGWMTYLCNLSLTLALEYHWEVDRTVSTFVGLSLTMAFVVIYGVLNFVWLDVYLASIYTLYPAILMSLIGVMTESGVNDGASIMAVVLLSLTALLFIVKNVANCVKAKKRAENYGILDYGYDMATI